MKGFGGNVSFQCFFYTKKYEPNNAKDQGKNLTLLKLVVMVTLWRMF